MAMGLLGLKGGGLGRLDHHAKGTGRRGGAWETPSWAGCVGQAEEHRHPGSLAEGEGEVISHLRPLPPHCQPSSSPSTTAKPLPSAIPVPSLSTSSACCLESQKQCTGSGPGRAQSLGKSIFGCVGVSRPWPGRGREAGSLGPGAGGEVSPQGLTMGVRSRVLGGKQVLCFAVASRFCFCLWIVKSCSGGPPTPAGVRTNTEKSWLPGRWCPLLRRKSGLAWAAGARWLQVMRFFFVFFSFPFR